MIPRRRGERTQKGNPHRLTREQHIIPAATLRRFTQSDGRVEVHFRDGRIAKLPVNDQLFCVDRLWDQRSVRTSRKCLTAGPLRWELRSTHPTTESGSPSLIPASPGPVRAAGSEQRSSGSVKLQPCFRTSHLQVSVSQCTLISGPSFSATGACSMISPR